MTHSDIDGIVARLVEVTDRVEVRLGSQHVAAAHLVGFSLREVLADVRRLLSSIDALDTPAQPERCLEQVREIAAFFVSGIAPHSAQHMADVVEAIDAHLDGAGEPPGPAA